MAKVCILTSAHVPNDHRIFHKQAKSLEKAGYEVTLIAHHHRSETQNGVKIIPIAPSRDTTARFLDLFKIYQVARDLEAEIYHIHDPTLLPFAVALGYRTDGKVIYDVHEDYREAFQAYSMIPDVANPLVRRFWPVVEANFSKRLDGIIAATDYIAELFRKRGHQNVVTVRNFPDVSSLKEQEIPISRNSEYVLIFTGGVDELRGLTAMVDATARLREEGYNVSLWLLGNVKTQGGKSALEQRLVREGHSEYVRILGNVDHSEVYSYQRKADVGLVLVPKIVDGKRYYRRGIPTKMIEYMYAELPVVATDTIGVIKHLPSDCGVIVPSDDLDAQVEAIGELLDSPKQRMKMGEAGRKHVKDSMSWQSECEKLLSFYSDLLD